MREVICFIFSGPRLQTAKVFFHHNSKVAPMAQKLGVRDSNLIGIRPLRSQRTGQHNQKVAVVAG